ncbi:hypothetical protein Cpap_2752 [Ruminiclostridium papyrosolvens DSM 2782]|uniref:Uncharacterized protein n=1 Tax=Ruminiclostridium papyrosolvens DSM 2782 TaxID=588581 RepID=F1TCF0_9FIRM|nr:hypothetical protein Cpap_2752 [Ruminiclostridium papyrosolvens DSM 2782]
MSFTEERAALYQEMRRKGLGYTTVKQNRVFKLPELI